MPLIFSSAMFSRTAVVCITVGFITLLSMIIVAVYKSNQPRQFIKGSNKSLNQGLSALCFSPIIGALFIAVVLMQFSLVNRFDKVGCSSYGYGYPYIRGYYETH